MPIILQTKVRSKLRGLSRTMSQITKEALQDTAMRWHDKILPKHFGPNAPTEYRHEQRAKGWKEAKRFLGKGQGRFRDLMFRGKLRRWMSTNPRVSGTSKRAILRMQAPAYVKINPAGQPDKEAELTRISDKDRTALSTFMDNRIDNLIAEAQQNIQPTTRTL